MLIFVFLQELQKIFGLVFQLSRKKYSYSYPTLFYTILITNSCIEISRKGDFWGQ